MTLRWGIVTAGKISHDFVAAFNSYPDVGDQVIAAVAARDRSRAEEFAKVHKIGTVYDTYADMAKSNGIDIAYIGAWNHEHYNLSKLFLDNGKHVVCEKPLCLNLKQAQSLVNLARRKKLFFMEAVWSRFSPIYHALEREIQSGKLGDLKHVEVNFGVVNPTSNKEFGGGALLDVGVYPLQFAQFVYKDEPTKVTAIGNVNEQGVDIIDTMVLEYTGGRRAVLNIDVTVKLWNKATVVGTKGRVTVEDPFNFPTILIHVDGKVEEIPLHTSKIPYNYTNSAGLVYEAIEVERCIRAGLLESPKMSHKESLLLAKLEDTIRQQVGVHFDEDDQEFP